MPREDVGEEPYRERDEPHEVGEHLDPEDQRLSDRVHVLEPGGKEALQVAEQALRPDPLDVVAEPDDEGEDERKRDVGGRRVDGEGRDPEAEDVDGLGAVRRQREVADDVREGDEEEEGRDEGKPLRRVGGGQVPAGDVVLGHVVGDLDRRLHAVGLHLHAAGDVDHHPDRQCARQHEVEDRPVDREVDATDVDGNPVVELELVLGLELVVLAVAAEDHQQGDRDREVDPAREQDLLLGRPIRHGYDPAASWGSISRISRRAPKWTVNRIAARTAAARPASLLSITPTSSTARAMIHTRTSMVAPIHPIAARRSPAASARADERSAVISIACWRPQTAAITTNATIGRSAARNTGRAATRRTRSRYLSAVAMVGSVDVRRAHEVLAPHHQRRPQRRRRTKSNPRRWAGGRRMLAAVPRSRRVPLWLRGWLGRSGHRLDLAGVRIYRGHLAGARIDGLEGAGIELSQHALFDLRLHRRRERGEP